MHVANTRNAEYRSLFIEKTSCWGARVPTLLFHSKKDRTPKNQARWRKSECAVSKLIFATMNFVGHRWEYVTVTLEDRRDKSSDGTER